MSKRRRVFSEDKVHLHVMISRDVYEMLVKIAPEIYGAKRHRGALSYVVEQALRAYLAPRLHTQTRTNPQGKVRRVYELFVKCLEELNGGFKPDVAPAKQVYTCISEIRGSDPRTIERWVGIFKRQGLMKDLTPNNPWHRKLYEII